MPSPSFVPNAAKPGDAREAPRAQGHGKLLSRAPHGQTQHPAPAGDQPHGHPTVQHMGLEAASPALGAGAPHLPLPTAPLLPAAHSPRNSPQSCSLLPQPVPGVPPGKQHVLTLGGGQAGLRGLCPGTGTQPLQSWGFDSSPTIQSHVPSLPVDLGAGSACAAGWGAGGSYLPWVVLLGVAHGSCTN